MNYELIWCGRDDDKIYKQNPGFSSTVADSFSAILGSDGPYGVSWDGSDVLGSSSVGTEKMYKLTGFSSTIQDSFAIGGSYASVGIKWGTSSKLLWIESPTTKMMKNTGFTSTIEDSYSISIDTNPRDVDQYEGDTFWTGITDDKFYQNTGFSSTLADSIAVASIDNIPKGFTRVPNGDSVWLGNEAIKMYKNTGFSATVNDSFSISAIETGPEGMDSNWIDPPTIDLVHADRVFETTTSTGTSTINLAGAETGYRTFVAGVGDGRQCFYTIEAVDGDGLPTGDWEHGIGTVTDATPDTLSRDVVISSSNSNTWVNFSAGTKNVYCTPGSRAFMEVGCRIYRATSNFEVGTGGSYKLVEFNAEDYDPFGMHDNVTNNSRVTIAIPGRYLLVACIEWDTAPNLAAVPEFLFFINGSRTSGRQSVADEKAASHSDILELDAGDYVELAAYQSSGSSLYLVAESAGVQKTYMIVQRLTS